MAALKQFYQIENNEPPGFPGGFARGGFGRAVY